MRPTKQTSRLHSAMRVSAACFLLFVVCCGVAGSLLILLTQLRHDKVRTAAATAVPAARHITKSLAELRNEGPVPELSDHVLFFNHVPKAGGEMLVLLLQWLQGLNGFRHVRLRGGARRRLSRAEQEELVEEVVSTIKKEAVPITFDRHVYFINFTQFDRQSPMYINLVRDPVIKASSRFYYSRVTPNPRNPDIKGAPVRNTNHPSSKTFSECVLSSDPECTFVTGQPYDLSIPYFCGQEEWCMLLNNERALEKAKANVDRYFPVVGVLEELNATLYVLERRLPYFFRGIQKIYFEELSAREDQLRAMSKHMRQHRERDQQVHVFEVLDQPEILYPEREEEELTDINMSNEQFKRAQHAMNINQRQLFNFITESIRDQINGDIKRERIFITGGAGNGKTFLFNLLKNQVNWCYGKLVVKVGALTRVAARLVSGSTLNSLLKLPVQKDGVIVNMPLLSEPHMNRNNKHLHNIPKEVRSRLEETLKTEYEFYTWIRARLLLQLK